jgi:hypothetical protein
LDPPGTPPGGFFFGRTGPRNDEPKEARMGGLVRAPKPAAPVENSAATVEAQRASIAAETQASSEAATQEARQKALARARRGLPGTIATSARGVLDPAPAFAARKNLLGE